MGIADANIRALNNTIPFRAVSFNLSLIERREIFMLF